MKQNACGFTQSFSRGAGCCSGQARLPGEAYSLLLQRKMTRPTRRIRRADLIECEERKLSLIDNNLIKHR